jgi:hypothetical protein
MDMRTVLLWERMAGETFLSFFSKHRKGNHDLLLGASPEARRRHTIPWMGHAEFTAATSALNLNNREYFGVAEPKRSVEKYLEGRLWRLTCWKALDGLGDFTYKIRRMSASQVKVSNTVY